MPLGPLPVTNTARYFVDYKSNGVGHTMLYRYLAPGGGGEPTTTFIARVATLLNDIKSLLPTDFTISGARYAALGSTVTLPATAPAGPAGTGTPQAYQKPAYFSFVARSRTGRRIRWTFLGSAYVSASAAAAQDYRVTSAELAAVATAVTNISGWCGLGGTDGLYGIDGTSGAIVKPYIDLGYSAYWTRTSRG